MYRLADTEVQNWAQHSHLQAAQQVNMPITHVRVHCHVHCNVHCTGCCVSILLHIPVV